MMSGRMLGGCDQETLDLTFRALDMRGRGNIDLKQFKYLVTNVGDKLSEREADHLLTDVDIYNDGVISYTEFVKMLTEEQKNPEAEEHKTNAN